MECGDGGDVMEQISRGEWMVFCGDGGGGEQRGCLQCLGVLMCNRCYGGWVGVLEVAAQG